MRAKGKELPALVFVELAGWGDQTDMAGEGEALSDMQLAR